MIPQHSLPGGRYPLPGPDFHRLDRASFAWRTRTDSKAPKETKAAKETKAPKEKGGKAEPAASPGGQKPNALQKALQPSKELAAVVGTGPLPRGEVVSKVWDLHQEARAAEPGKPA